MDAIPDLYHFKYIRSDEQYQQLAKQQFTVSETVYPHIIFSFDRNDRKEYKTAELLTVFSADFLDLIYLHNVIPPE